MPPEASAGVPKGTYRKYVPEGIQVPLRARASKSEQCAGFARVSYERKTLQAFFDSRLNQSKSEQCAGFASVSYERKTLQAFFDFRLNQSDFEQCGTCNERVSAKFPAPLATSAKREVPRATCNERGARSSPRRNRSRLL